MKISSKSDVGLVRDTNQDDHYFKILSQDAVWGIVCDGMGGANAGATASRLTVRAIKKEMESFEYTNMSELAIKEFLVATVTKVNRKIFQKSKDIKSLEGMGTTIILLAVIRDVLHIVHAGDSRAYLITKSKNQIKQLTIDHSIVQEMLDSGEITPEQAQKHPQKHVITRAVGVYEDILLDYVKSYLKEGDAVLICTDGLTNHVNDQTLLKTFVHASNSEECTEKLIELSKADGGSDNITVLLIDY